MAIALLLVPGPVEAQGFLEQFSYEGLRLSSISLELGAVASDRLTTEPTVAIRFDFGYVAPKIRVLLGGAYFKGSFQGDEIARFEQRVFDVVENPGPLTTINVGEISWAHWQGSFDLQYVFTPGAKVRPYAGLGVSVIVRNGDGAAINGTFVEDALDTITAGMTASLGVEVGLTEWLSVVADGRGELTGELRSVSARGGFKFHLPRGES